MTDTKKSQKGKPFSVRLTDGERLTLQERAAGQPLGMFIRSLLLTPEGQARTTRRGPVADGQPLGKLLALLGQSQFAASFNKLAQAASLGTLPVTEEIERGLHQASADIAEMRNLLLHALGLRKDVESPVIQQRSPIPSSHKTVLPVAELFANTATASPTSTKSESQP